MMRRLKQLAGLAVIGVIAVFARPAVATSFDITVNFVGGLTESQQAVFSLSEAFWESKVTGYQAGAPTPSSLTINVEGKEIDGTGGILGSAGPTSVESGGGFLVASQGMMELDTADLADLEGNDTLVDVITHEMAHVMGFGTLWNGPAEGTPGTQSVYQTDSGEYTGARALAAYQAEFDPTAIFVPVELDGGEGTANAHWDEDWAGGGNALMTGFLDTPTFVSQTTIASFADIGYAVVPLPAAAWLFLSAAGAMGVIGWRRRTT